MSATDIAFLVVGFVLGLAVGATLVAAFRARSAGGTVRLTVAQDSVPKRASTLSAPDRLDRSEPVLGSGPATRGHAAAVPVMDAPRALALGLATRSRPVAPGTSRPVARTPVPSHGAPDERPDAGPTPTPQSQSGGSETPLRAIPAARPAVRIPDDAVGIPVEPEVAHETASEPEPPAAPDGGGPTAGGPASMALLAAAALAARTATLMATSREFPLDATRASSTEPPPDAADDGSVPVPPAGAAGAAGATGTAGAAGEAASAPCADERRTATERCAIAERARVAAREAADALHEAQRAYDAHAGRVDAAEAALDPRAIRARKEAAQRAFREARATAVDREGSERAAREWLHEINRVNTEMRDAARVVEQEREEVRRLVPTIERLALEADGARIAAESAEAACLEAREAVARCEEEAARPVPPPEAFPVAREAGLPLEPDGLRVAADGVETTIVRLLRGDRATLERLVARLGGDDGEERRQWRLRLATLADAIAARAIEEGYLDPPDDHRFWATFTRSQVRDIVTALGSLGFHYDGIGGFADDRLPSQRDLSLAVGYAGLDPMRIRVWPSESEMASLLEGTVVAADEWLASAAGDLLLGEMVDALGRRADDLADVWNAWGRLRPLLLEPV